MKSLCIRLNHNATPEEVNKWGITGLLHDADYEMATGHPEKHGLLLFEKLPSGTVPAEIAHAVQAHNWQYTNVLPETPLDWAIACCDQLTGLIVAATLVHPTKKLASLTPEFVISRYNERSFAKGANRRAIADCEAKLGIPLLEFVTITLSAMQGISNELGL